MEKNKELRIVRGNDFIINMPVKNIVFLRDELGYTTKGVLPTDFANCKDIEVNLADGCGWYKPVEFVVKDDLLQIKIDGNIECGWYGVELRYVYEDVKYRSYERKVFKIVESNGGSYATPDVYEGELGYHIDAVWSLACVVDEVYLRSLVGTKSYERGSGENSAQQIGTGAQALGDGSHAEGLGTKALANGSHAEGVETVTSNLGEHACGILNVSNTGDDAADCTAFSVGIGKPTKYRRNGIEVRQNGDIYLWYNGEYVCLQEVLGRTDGTGGTSGGGYGHFDGGITKEEIDKIVTDYLDKDIELQ